jgi:hypothetical protein
MFDRILVAKIGWAPKYQGENISCAFGKKGDDGFERSNFQRFRGIYYGSIPR